MEKTLTLTLIVPKWRIHGLRIAIYGIAAACHLGLISAARVEGLIDSLSAWVVKGVRVRVS